MKKFASLFIAMLLVISMLSTGIISVSAAGLDFNKKASIIMEKLDFKGNTVEGAEFTAYKVLALNNDGDGDGTYTVEDAFKAVISANDLKASAKNGSKGGLYTSTDALEAKISALEACSKDATGKLFTDNKQGNYSIDNLDLGVYLIVETKAPKNYIKSTSPFLVTVPQWDADANEWDYVVGDNGQPVKPKNLKVKLDKTQAGGKDADVYAIGDTIKYTVKATLPDYGYVTGTTTKYTSTIKNDWNLITVKFADTMTAGLTFKKDLVVKVDDITTAEAGDTITLTANDFKKLEQTNSGFTAIINWSALDAYQGAEITLAYSAVLNEKAVVDTNSNDNTVKYTFSNKLDRDYILDPNTGNLVPDPDQPEFPTEEQEDTTKAYTFAMNLTKTFNNKTAADANVDATKVTFKLIDKATNKAIAVTATADGYAVNTAVEATNNNTAMTLKADGTLYVKGLKDTGYYLEETVAADGYSKLPTKVELVLTEDKTANAIGVKAQHYVNGNANDLEETGRNTFALTVNNVKKQFNLPTTGGLGIWMFTIAGGILMAGAIILFASIRRKSEEK